MPPRRLETPDGIVIAVLTIYGLVAFLNPERYPILSVILQNTESAHLGAYDPLIGLILFVLGLLAIFRPRRP